MLCEGDFVVSDEFNYVSIIDGLWLMKVIKKIYKYVDFVDFDWVLCENFSEGLKFVVIDGVFSMDGDVVLFDKLVEVVCCYGVVIYVDDVYGLGVMGEVGCGMVYYFGFEYVDDVI